MRLGKSSCMSHLLMGRQRIMAVMILPILLSNCAGAQHRMEVGQFCREQAGPRPYPAAEAFGLVGGLFAAAQPERQAWDARVRACVVARS